MTSSDKADTGKTVVPLAITRPSFLAPMALSSVNVALPTIAKGFVMDGLSLSWAVTAYMAAVAMFLVPLGRLADIIGRKKIFLFGTGVFTVASFLLSVAPSTGFLITFIKPTTPMWFIVGSLVVPGIGFALFSSPNTNVIEGSVERNLTVLLHRCFPP